MDDSMKIVKAIILYLNDMGFDFEKNSAIDLIYSFKEISRLATEDEEIGKEITKRVLEEDEDEIQ